MTDTLDGQESNRKTFYGAPVGLGQDPLSQELSPTEKQDSMKTDHSSDDDTSSKCLVSVLTRFDA